MLTILEPATYKRYRQTLHATTVKQQVWSDE